MPGLIYPWTKTGAISNAETSYWDNVVADSGTVLTAIDPGNLRGSIVQVTFSRTEPTGLGENAAMFTLHLGNDPGTGGAINQLTDAHLALVEGWLDTFWTAIKSLYSPHWLLSGYLWRHFAADGPRDGAGRIKPTPLYRSTTRSVAGTAASVTHPDQVSETITFRTPSRRHWGRIYLPATASAYTTAEARIPSAQVDTIAAAFRTFMTTAHANADPIDVMVWNGLHPGALPVTSLSMDDIFDVQRRRRTKTSAYRKIYVS